MAKLIKCAKGHWYPADPTGKPTPCPRCLSEANKPPPKPISDDDIIEFLNDSTEPVVSASESSGDLQKLHKQSLKRHKKICPACHGETSFAFEYCPRCGGPLEVAVIEMPSN